jgi:hypothetical protein
MEKSLAPRTLVYVNRDETGKSNIESLKQFPGLQVIINFAPDAEASRAAFDIKNIAEFAGWKVLVFEERRELSFMLFDGVIVQSYFGKRPLTDEYEGARRSCNAADALIEFLTSNNWAAKSYAAANVGELVSRGDPLLSTIPPNTIRVNVGLRPAPYFLPKNLKEAYERVEEAHRQIRDLRKKNP